MLHVFNSKRNIWMYISFSWISIPHASNFVHLCACARACVCSLLLYRCAMCIRQSSSSMDKFRTMHVRTLEYHRQFNQSIELMRPIPNVMDYYHQVSVDTQVWKCARTKSIIIKQWTWAPMHCKEMKSIMKYKHRQASKRNFNEKIMFFRFYNNNNNNKNAMECTLVFIVCRLLFIFGCIHYSHFYLRLQCKKCFKCKRIRACGAWFGYISKCTAGLSVQ